MNSELSIVSMITNASVLVQLVMAVLMLISLGSWSIIFRKWFAIRAAKQATDRFETEFWKDRDLGTLYQQVRNEGHDHGSLARIFESGMGEFLKTRQQKPGDIAAMLDGSRRAMRAAYQRERDQSGKGRGRNAGQHDKAQRQQREERRKARAMARCGEESRHKSQQIARKAENFRQQRDRAAPGHGRDGKTDAERGREDARKPRSRERCRKPGFLLALDRRGR